MNKGVHSVPKSLLIIFSEKVGCVESRQIWACEGREFERFSSDLLFSIEEYSDMPTRIDNNDKMCTQLAYYPAEESASG